MQCRTNYEHSKKNSLKWNKVGDALPLIDLYNKFMGNVDLADQQVSAYDIDHKYIKWLNTWIENEVW